MSQIMHYAYKMYYCTICRPSKLHSPHCIESEIGGYSMFNDQSYTVVYVNSYNVQWHTHSSHTKKFNQNFNQKLTRYFQHFQAGPLCNILKNVTIFGRMQPGNYIIFYVFHVLCIFKPLDLN